MVPPPKGSMTDPFDTPLPDGDLYPDEEVSKVRNPGDAWKKLEKLDRVLNRMVEPISQIPDIRDKVEAIGERVAKVEERVANTKDRVDTLDQKAQRPHDCFQVDNIEKIEVSTLSLRKNVEEETRKIGLIAKDVTDLRENQKSVKELRRSTHYFWIAIAIGFFTTAGSAIWYMRGVSADIQLESQARAAQFQQVETVLTKVSKQSDPAPVQQDLRRLEKAVKAANGHSTTEEYCAGLSEGAVRAIKRSVPVEEWPDCRRFRAPSP